MGKPSRDKGARREREAVALFRDWGLTAQRVPLSGATSFQKHDIQVEGLFAEVKSRAKPIASIEGWLADEPDFVMFKPDRLPWRFIVDEDQMCWFMRQVFKP